MPVLALPPSEPLAGDGRGRVFAALAALRRGEHVLLTDDEGGESPADLVLAAAHATPGRIAFMVRHTSGLLCVAMTAERLRTLRIPQMVPTEADATGRTALAVSVDLARGVSSGISARDRACTIRALGDPSVVAADFTRPGHVLPLRARDGGVLARRGRAEAAVDLARLAGCTAAGVIAGVVGASGDMARAHEIAAFADRHGLLALSVAELVAHRRATEVLVRRATTPARQIARDGFIAVGYRSLPDGAEHVALVLGRPDRHPCPLVSVHGECVVGDVFGAGNCSCGAQLHQALSRIEEHGNGVLIYLRDPQQRRHARASCGGAVDADGAAQIATQVLRDLGVRAEFAPGPTSTAVPA